MSLSDLLLNRKPLEGRARLDRFLGDLGWIRLKYHWVFRKMRTVCFYATALCSISIIIILSAIHDPVFLLFELV